MLGQLAAAMLGEGAHLVRSPIHLEVSRASARAIAAIEAAGGTVTCAHYNRLALRALLRPEKFAARFDGAATIVRNTTLKRVITQMSDAADARAKRRRLTLARGRGNFR